MSRSLGAPPTMRGRNEKGELLVGRDFGDGNPLVNDDKFIRNNNSDKFTMSQGFKIDLLKNLWLKVLAWGGLENIHYSSIKNQDPFLF